MKTLLFSVHPSAQVILSGLALLTVARVADGAEWPVLRSYRGRNLEAVAMPLGGIGTGTISLSGRGSLVDWEVVNRSAIGWVPAFKLKPPSIATAPFFLVYARPAGGPATTLLLEGPIPQRESNYAGDWGAEADNAEMPRFECNEFLAAYPLAQVAFEDPLDAVLMEQRAWRANYNLAARPLGNCLETAPLNRMGDGSNGL